MSNSDALWRIITQRFRTIAAFSKAIGWRYQKAWRIANGKQIPDSDDIRELCTTLDLRDPAAIVAVFSLA